MFKNKLKSKKYAFLQKMLIFYLISIVRHNLSYKKSIAIPVLQALFILYFFKIAYKTKLIHKLMITRKNPLNGVNPSKLDKNPLKELTSGPLTIEHLNSS